MSRASGIRQVGYVDCPGGGQVVVSGTTAYVAHMKAPDGTSIIDVADPARPRTVATLEVPPGVHSHKVRVSGDVMLVNREAQPPAAPEPGFQGGLAVFDVSTPARPRQLAFWPCGGRGVHRFAFDGAYAYASPEMDGYVGNIVMIVDLRDPRQPAEVGRWWMPGQWTAGGEVPSWQGRAHRCHHPLRLGDRLYVSYWHGGFVILDIADMTRPRLVAGLDWSPPFPSPTHTALPIPFPVRGRRVLVVTDEDVHPLHAGPPALLWVVDITDEAHPVPVASFQVAELDGTPQPQFSGCHQPCETVTGTEIPVAWFAQGLRIIDIANPHALREVAAFVPPPPRGAEQLTSNDVCVDERGLLYLIDRQRGLHVLERAG